MKKQGPCCHCGVTSTPLWRNGPPSKPVLCNACGSRWRTQGTLANYFPQHFLKFGPLFSEDSKNSRESKLPAKRKTKSLNKINQNVDDIEVGETTSAYYLHKTSFEDDTSNRSSSGSGVSFSESCVRLASMDGNDISGSEQSHFWDPQIPSRKRTSIECHSPSPVEKLRRELCGILQEQESSNPSESLEEVLLFERQDPTVSVETSLGSILIKRPLLSEEESQASSSRKEIEVSCLNNSFMGPSCVQVSSQSCEISSSLGGKERKELKEPPAKRRALAYLSSENSLFSHHDIPHNMAATEGSVKNRNHSKTNVNVLWESSSTAWASISRLPKDHMQMARSLSSMNRSVLAPGRNSIVFNSIMVEPSKLVSECPLSSDSGASCPLQDTP